jgi:hypothetical protein
MNISSTGVDYMSNTTGTLKATGINIRWSTYIVILVFSGIRVTRSLVLCVCFVDRCLSVCTFSFGHCVVCSSSIYGFWLPPFCIFKPFFSYIWSVVMSYYVSLRSVFRVSCPIMCLYVLYSVLCCPIMCLYVLYSDVKTHDRTTQHGIQNVKTHDRTTNMEYRT